MTHRYVARQIIVDRQKKVYAYELLYRNSAANFYPAGVPADTATKDLIATLNIDFNTEELTKGHQAFINFPREVLLSEAITYLDPQAYMIEVLEDVEIDTEIVERIHQLKKMGYQFAADDYTGEQNIEPIQESLSVIKIDIPLTSDEVQVQIIEEHGTTKRMLAEKIENEEEFQKALEMGYHLFQGYYFARPTLIIRESIGFSQGAVMNLLKETRQEDVDFDKIDNIVHSDAGLTYHLLSRGNTAQFAGKTKFTNPSQVTVRMGIEELQKWATLMLMQQSAEEGQDDKMELALLRGLFLQSLVMKLKTGLDRDDRYYVYLKGMFSVFPESHRKEVFDALAFEIDLDLIDLADSLLDFIYAYEVGDYDKIDEYMQQNKLTDAVVMGCYKSAIANANSALSS